MERDLKTIPKMPGIKAELVERGPAGQGNNKMLKLIADKGKTLLGVLVQEMTRTRMITPRVPAMCSMIASATSALLINGSNYFSPFGNNNVTRLVSTPIPRR